MGIFYEFSKVSNLYFLLSAVLQTFPIVASLDPFSGFMPVLIVVGFSLSREGYEDYQRRKSDIQTNKIEVKVLQSDGSFELMQSSEI